MLSRSTLGWFAPCIAQRCSSSVPAYRSAPVDESTHVSLPSRQFVKYNVRTTDQKERLTSVVSEIEMYKEFFGPNSIPDLTDQQWGSLLSIKVPDERCRFIAAIHYDNDNGNKSIKEMESFNGDPPSEFQLFDLRGQELRRQIDAMYGSRLWSHERCDNNDMPRLIIDARFLATFASRTQPVFTRAVQELHDLNWSSPHPFPVSIANLRPDAQLSELIKRHWRFIHGPPSESDNYSSFRVHPFSPTVSPRSVSSILKGVDKDDIIYISQRSKQFLPEKAPLNMKAVVVCLTSDSRPETSSSVAAIAEGLTPYRIPIQKYINYSKGYRNPPIWEMAATLRAWMRGEGWRDAIEENIVTRGRMSTRASGVTAESFIAFRAAVLEMNNAEFERKEREKKEDEREETERRRGNEKRQLFNS